MAGQRKALIIANDTYEQEALQDLLAPDRDLRYPPRRAVQQPGLGQMRNRPSDTVSE